MTLVGWPSSAPRLEDGGIVLRAWTPADAAAVFEACQDVELQHWLPVPVPYEREHARGFVEEFAPAQWAGGRGAPFAVADAATDELLGTVSLKEVDGERGSAEIGYWTTPTARGRGVATRALRLLVDWALERGLDRLELHIEPANAASCAVAEAVGASRVELREAAEMIRGSAHDLAIYVIARGDRRRAGEGLRPR